MRTIHKCDNCGKTGFWTETWWWFGSKEDEDHGAVAKFCCDACRLSDEEATKIIMEKRRNF